MGQSKRLTARCHLIEHGVSKLLSDTGLPAAITGQPITNRGDRIASIERFKRLARNLHATVVIRRGPRDIARPPSLPIWAE